MTVIHHPEPLIDEHWQGEEPDCNRPRCVHGCYLHEGCRTIGCPDGTGA